MDLATLHSLSMDQLRALAEQNNVSPQKARAMLRSELVQGLLSVAKGGPFIETRHEGTRDFRASLVSSILEAIPAIPSIEDLRDQLNAEVKAIQETTAREVTETVQRMRDAFTAEQKARESMLRAMLADHIKPQRVYVDPVKGTEVTPSGSPHEALPQAVWIARHHPYRCVYLQGPAGTGKTTLGTQLGEVLGRPSYVFACSRGTSESMLWGRDDLDGHRYHGTEALRMVEEGGVLVLDEWDSADPSVAISCNSLLAQGRMSLPRRRSAPHVKRHPDSIIVACANTMGRTVDAEYTARERQDTAVLDRFAGAFLYVDYDKHLERTLCEDESALTALWRMRSNVQEASIAGFVVSTRAVAVVGSYMRGGATLKGAIDMLVTPLDKIEREQVLEGVTL